MQYKQNPKIIIDKRKLDILIRLKCPKENIYEAIVNNKIIYTKDKLIDETLETLADIKVFENWGGDRKGAGRKSNNNNKINQDEIQLENQDEIQLENQDVNQVVDIDKDIDIDIDKYININNKNNKYIFGEFKNVRLSEDEYNKLKEIYKNKLNEAIEILSSYIASKGKKYKNHYAVLGKHNWVYKKINEKNNITEKQGMYEYV